jgi:hypothetical protein
MDQNKETGMFSLDFQKKLFLTIAAAAVCFLAAPGRLAAASPETGATITYTASGTFASTPVSGTDTLKLAGQPFNISVVGNSALKPTKSGKNWALFTPLKMSGSVYSGLVPGTPIPISSSEASIEQTIGTTDDIFQFASPVYVSLLGLTLTVDADLPLPLGTIKTPLMHPFKSVALTTTSTVTYSDTTSSTELAIEVGTLVAVESAAGPDKQ